MGYCMHRGRISSRSGASALLPTHPEKKVPMPGTHEHQDSDETTPEAAPGHMHPYTLLLCGCILELLYLLIVALAPLPGLHLSSTPLAAAWRWTLLPSRIIFPGAWASPGYYWMHVVLFSVTLIAITGIYAYAVWKYGGRDVMNH